MFAYIVLAKKFKILDIPNNRSSHTKPIIRGGGIIFPISVLIYAIFFEFSYAYFLISLLLISVISFLDDIYTISSKWRFLVQLIAALLLIVELFNPFSFYCLLLIPVLVGILNGYNFMDGINGITASYSFVNIITLLVINQGLGFVENDLLLVLLFSVLIFSFLNFRNKAICFAGDVGSVSIALIVLFLLFKLIITTLNPVYILLLVVYGIDTGVTLFVRLKNGENIFNPHREHLYQKIVDVSKWSHTRVSLFYSLIQIVINVIVVYFLSMSELKYFLSSLIIFILYFSYTFVKNKLVKK
jgi:UDP-N-acetylmuramyl pentapeptide phosphotransferase/UDP-N-acetylglucosamine-1-phosphate transferase